MIEDAHQLLPVLRELAVKQVLGENLLVSLLVNVVIHASQFPENVRRDLLESLRARQINHKFHYDSIKQTQKWLALHQQFSPTRNDADCVAVYDQSYKAAAACISSSRVHLIGLGCGGGQKDTRLLGLLKHRPREVFYTPCDVSAAMVLVAWKAALAVVPKMNCFPFVCDLALADDLPAIFERQRPADSSRLLTFFGMIPNFEPQLILPKLAALMRPDDLMLFSANLAPGPDYTNGLREILPQYDNQPTRDWLMTLLLDLGVEREDGQLRFQVETDAENDGLKRVVAWFHLSRACEFQVDSERFAFRNGDAVRLFFSYRYTPLLVEQVLGVHGFKVQERWITKSEEEGVFLVTRK